MKTLIKNKILIIIFGLTLGILIGGYIGLVIGGTFLGSFDIYENIGIEGYELSAYIGAIVGAITGLILSNKFYNKKNKKN